MAVKSSKPRKSEVFEGLAMYTFIHKPDSGNPKRKIAPAYKIDLMLADEKEQARAKKLGIVLKEPTDKHKYPFITVKSKVTPDREKPFIVDSKNQVLPDHVLVGNGSKVRVKLLPFTYGENEVTAILQGIQVIDLIPYERKPDFEVVEGGFTMAPASAETGSGDDEVPF